MREMKRGALAVLLLCALVSVGMVASHLALTDIQLGVEPNLEGEWWVVRVSFMLNAALIVAAGLLALGLIGHSADEPGRPGSG